MTGEVHGEARAMAIAYADYFDRPSPQSRSRPAPSLFSARCRHARDGSKCRHAISIVERERAGGKGEIRAAQVKCRGALTLVHGQRNA